LFAEVFSRIRGELSLIGPNAVVLVGDGDAAGLIPFTRFVANAPEREPPGAHLPGSDVFDIMYSSDTTGLPKGIVHTRFVRAMYCTLFAQAWRMTQEHRTARRIDCLQRLHAGPDAVDVCRRHLYPA
jgi:acyl-coenzyme A synthetase/AMP-(fatty) acid ligase